MIVVGSHGHGALYHLLLGSVSEGIIRKTTCPVLVVRLPLGTRQQTTCSQKGERHAPEEWGQEGP